MKLLLDATVVRPPHAGVALSVVSQVASIVQGSDTDDITVCGRDQLLGAVVSGAPRACPGPESWPGGVVGRILWQQLALPGLVKRLGVDVLHALAYTCPLRAVGCPVVLNVHDLIALEAPRLCSFANALHMRLLMPGSIRRADALVVSSSAVADGLRARFALDAQRIHRVPLGVDTARFGPPAALPPSLAHLTGRPYFLFVGNIEPKKGVDQLVNAYAACAAETGCDLVIAGRFCWKSGTVRRALRRPARHGRVHLPGRVPDAALAALYQHALAFVFPSRVEGFGLPVLEAMAAGTPVIHSDHPVLLETAGGAGYAFPVDDVEELSRALITLAREPGLRRELTHRGRERAASCRWEAWGRTVRRIYRELVGGGDRSAGGEHRSGDQGAGTGRIR